MLDVSQYVLEQPRRWDLPLEHLSQSSLTMLQRCFEQFRQRYILGKKERPGEALVVGTAVHLAAEANFKQKIESHEDAPLAVLVDWYDDVGFPKAVSEREEEGDEVKWDTDPDGARLRGRAITAAYHVQVAPRVQPLSVETRVEADFGLPVPVIGYADCIEEHRVIDIKTSKRASKYLKPHWSTQAAIYGTITGKPVDFHVASASEKEYRATVYTPLESSGLSVWLPPGGPREAVIENVQLLAGIAQYLMETRGPDQPWPTTGTQHDWACNWCGFRDACIAWRGRES